LCPIRKHGIGASRSRGGTDWGLGAVAAAQALLAAQDDAEALFVEAIDRLQRAQIGLHLARTHLSYGEWLRRANRRVDARRQLTTAHQSFIRIGAHGFTERARRELVATGEKVRSSRSARAMSSPLRRSRSRDWLPTV
jgi:hypothetical protein